ncbi:MAG: methylmalonyl-CoA mutase family protein, partial [Mycobacteriales bacterium]
MTQPTAPALHKPAHHVRFVTAASLFDGHDAAINIMRRVLQSQGVEVVHLGHDRSVDAVVAAALQEDAQGIAVSSYQGGHVEYFTYLVERLREVGAGHVQVFGGGGGVIVPEEIALLKSRGVTIFAPEDGQRLGLAGMINTMVASCDVDLAAEPPALDPLFAGNTAALARAITVLEDGRSPELAAAVHKRARSVPVLGITGTGGSGKSSLTDELLRRFRLDQEDKLRIAVLAIDPTRRKGGGALLGDRIRMNSLAGDRIYFRSMATRTTSTPLPPHLNDVIAACKAADFDLVVIETPGIGQGDASVSEHADVSLYVMTPEYGAASQLEKIDMLDAADVVAINKYERRGAEDARRDVARQMVRNREAFGAKWEDMPVFGTSAARFNDDGVTALYQHLRGLLVEAGLQAGAGILPTVATKASTGLTSVLPSSRERYLAEISEAVRGYHAATIEQAELARRRQHLQTARDLVQDPSELDALSAAVSLDPRVESALAAWPARVQEYSGDELIYSVRGKEINNPLTRETLSGNQVRRVSLPRTADDGELVGFLRRENLPGYFPFTAGVFPFKRVGEAPARMFAGEGDAFRTNRRFQVLSEGQPATRLSTAFDSVTLYGRDPDLRPDIYGKVGTSGVSIATLD